MTRYGYLVVEGQTDVEFVARVLRMDGLERVRQKSRLDPFWDDLVPKNFPYDDDLLKRVPVPLFLQNDAHAIAIHSAIGVTRLAETVQEDLALLPAGKIQAIGFVLDADSDEDPTSRLATLRTELDRLGVPLALPDAPGAVQHGKPNTGIFIFPDNQSAGTLENLLQECASVNYPMLLQNAQVYVAGLDLSGLNQEDLDEFNKPAGRQKTVIGSLSSVLKPGKSITVSIQDNRWVDEATLQQVERLRLFRQFLLGLLELPGP
jgi:hypothetical protein